MKKSHNFKYAPFMAIGLILPMQTALSQTSGKAADDEIFELSPFEVSADEHIGYQATSTLAGTRLRSNLKDIGSAIQVVTKEFMDDIGATDNTTLLQYTTNTEVAGTNGNFSGLGGGENEEGRFRNPSSTTRVRGLSSADNARDFYLTSLPWDGYNVERVDVQRGANSILFGLGSPAGIVNAGIKSANFYKNSGEVGVTFDKWGSTRLTFDVNHVLMKEQLAVRLSGLAEEEKYQQDGAFEKDKRLFVAMRYEPSFLKFENARTSFRAKYETGSIDRNAPRTVTPGDYITPWFDTSSNGLNKLGVDARWSRNDVLKIPEGVAQAKYTDGTTNPYYNPNIHWFGDVWDATMIQYGDVNGTGYTTKQAGIGETWNINASGAIVGGNASTWMNQRALYGIAPYNTYATNPGNNLPFADKGTYKKKTLSDATIFDFYNQLIDGPNKLTTADFKAYNIILEETFFGDKLGIELALDNQDYDDDQNSLLTNWESGIYIDINSYNIDGTPNQYFGTPYVAGISVNNKEGYNTKETRRASAYYDLDFEDIFPEKTFLSKLLGKHVFNYAYSEFEENQKGLGYLQWSGDDKLAVWKDDIKHKSHDRKYAVVNYLGGSLKDASSASGAYIPAIQQVRMPVAGPMQIWDSHWKGGVDPAAPYNNPWDGTVGTQSQNPDNYVGWSSQDFGILTDRNQLYTEGSVNRLDVESKIAVWTGKFWGGAIVPMWAKRKDTVDTWAKQFKNDNGLGTIDPKSVVISGDPSMNSGEMETKSLAVHVDELIGADRLPFSLSLFYNESENFNPANIRNDITGKQIPHASGTTKDKGILLSTKDRRYSVRATWYESSINNATNGVLNGNLWRFEQSFGWAGYFNAVKIREGARLTVQEPNSPHLANLNKSDLLPKLDGETDQQWLQRSIDFTAPVFDNFHSQDVIDAWGVADYKTNPSAFFKNQNTAQRPANTTATSDIRSEGFELEFTANPKDGWNMIMNVSQSKAFFDNVGGQVGDYIADFIERVNKTDSKGQSWAQFPEWGKNYGTATSGAKFAPFFSDYTRLKLQEGTAQPEIREWSANFVSTYHFSEGKFKGFRAGGGYRWQDDVALAYRFNPDGTFDIADPIRGGAEDYVDLWLGYGKKIRNDKVDWSVQLNVYNAFTGDNLIAVDAQPDGSGAQWRIGPRRSWKLSNTFRF